MSEKHDKMFYQKDCETQKIRTQSGVKLIRKILFSEAQLAVSPISKSKHEAILCVWKKKMLLTTEIQQKNRTKSLQTK